MIFESTRLGSGSCVQDVWCGRKEDSNTVNNLNICFTIDLHKDRGCVDLLT